MRINFFTLNEMIKNSVDCISASGELNLNMFLRI